jgi:hypothetical protein
MSLNQDNLKPIGGHSIPDILYDDYVYKTEDSQDTVETSGYFDTAPPIFSVPDRIHIMYMIGESVSKVITYIIVDTEDTISIEDALTYSPGIIQNTEDIDFLKAVVGAPVPIPPGDPDVLQFSIADNTTIGQVALWTLTTMTHWAYNLDSTATPTGDGTEGTINVGDLDLLDNDSHTLYGWYRDEDGADTWTQVKPDPLLDDGATVPGLVVQATNTLVPTTITDFSVAAGTDTTSQIVLTFTPSISVLSTQTDLYRAIDGTDILLSVNVSPNDEISNISAGVAYNLFLRVKDVNGLISDSNDASITLSAGENGTVSIVDALVVKVTDDDTATLNIPLQIVGRTQTAQTSTVTVSTADDTALAGTNFDVISSTTITFPANDNSDVNAVVTITTALENIKNLTGQLYIDPGSEGSDGGAGFNPVIAAYPDNATLFKIDGTGVVDGTAADQEADGGSNNIVFEMESYTSTGNTDGYAADDVWADFTGVESLVNDLSDGVVGGNMTVKAGAVLDDDTVFTTVNPRLDKLVNFDQTGVHYIWLRTRNLYAWRKEAYVGFNQSDNMTGGPLYTGEVNNTSEWHWTKHLSTYNVTTVGVQTFNLYKVDTWLNCDRVVITDNVAYTPAAVGAGGSPSGSDNEGPAVTGLAGGTGATDDPNNKTIADNPDPGTASYPPTFFQPVDGAGAVGVLDSIVMLWPEGTTALQVTMTVTDGDSSLVITGATTISQPTTGYGEGLAWSPAQAMVEATPHTSVVLGTCIAPDGTPRTINHTTYNFTTFDSGDASVLYSSNFNQFVSNTDFTAAQQPAAFGWVWGPGSGFGTKGQYAFFRDDPEGVRGTVMMMQLPPGQYAGDGVKVETRIDWSAGSDGNNATGVDEIWMAYDVFLSDNYKCASGHKMPGILAYGDSGPSSGIDNRGRNCALRGMYQGNLDDGSIPRPSWPYSFINKLPLPDGGISCPALLYYDADGTHGLRFCNSVDETVNISPTNKEDQYNMPRGQWVRNKFRMVTNTVNVNGPPADAGFDHDGIMEYYMDGVLKVKRTNIAWRSYDWVLWNLGYFTYFWGGGTTEWRSPDDQEQQMYVDRIVISTTDPDA